ncbi:hypothetical protein TPHA_0B04400 [Tetrapisispora phaffii CBS 4417]|uniref:SEC14 homolog 3 n=1 Tax=Tetrapisispora phaffii (strain ATCC 24235 / CBS 4417 / NBRC 1672 / NRRL Y-8282 / UCD 70-5) TaxID=1071381 RepID=G8BQ28_TETPH|nr:hypothetical protein TPHA_0B04400 [Tetrapisispora phaffii CBS 4417]CCE62109.1 hypothetical protein TPHA_0B04400 [Tetrapisispora phaffii CBS 4417]
MGLFSRKKPTKTDSKSVNANEHLIKVDTCFSEPPNEYGGAEPLENITSEQYDIYVKLLNHFNAEDFTLPVNTEVAKDDPALQKSLSEFEKFWLSRECLLRFLRAAKWNFNDAVANLSETMTWRREVGITYSDSNFENKALDPDHVSIENETGKEVLLGFDKHRRPLFYMKNGRQNTESSYRQVQQLIYMMECATTLCPQGVEKLTVLIDLKGYKEPGIISDKVPPLAITKLCLKVLQDYFPERMGKCLLTNIPWFAWAFLKIVYPFLDPATREKAIFDEPYDKHVEKKQLDATYNGYLDFKYDHKVYWPDLVKKVDELREKRFERWVKFGSKIGTAEWDYKGDHDEIKYPVDYRNVE